MREAIEASAIPRLAGVFMHMAEAIEQKLRAAFAPERLEVKDESHLHAGHAGARAGGQSHFRLLIVSKGFEGLSLIARQRAVNDVLRAELEGAIHALAMKTLTPDELVASAVTHKWQSP